MPYFKHVLEVLLLQALEQDFADSRNPRNGDSLRSMRIERIEAPRASLSDVIQFLDYFPQSREAVIACARKCEAEMWPTLFDTAGSPRKLFQVCLLSWWLHRADHRLLSVLRRSYTACPGAGSQLTGNHSHS